MSRPVLRFAPSPNGLLHLGHALSAITGFEYARKLGGRFLLRIEDIDTTRLREDFVQAIYDDLAWLGLSWETPVLRQSQHLADYAAAATRLDAMGLLYPCFASRKEILDAATPGSGTDPDGAALYPGLWKHAPPDKVAERKASGEPYALRLHMDRAITLARSKLGGAQLTFNEFDWQGTERVITCAPDLWGDVVVLRKETPASYLIAVVVDDARQGITHVTRGRDLYAATDTQRLLQVLLDLPEPLYHHHRLIEDATGAKLSKSAGAEPLSELRRRGIDPSAIRRMAGLDPL